MNKLPRIFLVLFLFILFLLLAPVNNSTLGEEIGAEYPELSPEELAWIEIPEVITPARIAQPITEAPSSVSVITAEEIHRSGLTNIPDILRRLAGVDVMALSPSDINVGIRGLNGTVSNKILVMIDGRSVYMDFYGTTIWSTLPILLEEIKRIEVVRGPGSALYGANAFSGVINIITKTPEEQKDTLISASAGTNNTYQGTAITAGNLNDLGYKLALGWKEAG
ncbi:MAG TPA: TonB-dependent receptor, partial [Proteobacteria bacterium]|nr:TonB-dependent receptor [Pseudomonadota bacterium]